MGNGENLLQLLKFPRKNQENKQTLKPNQVLK